MRCPQTIGEELPSSGSATFQRIFSVALQRRSTCFSGEWPSPCGPRQPGQWLATAGTAGVPDRIAAFTVNKVCGSGLKAVMLAAQAIGAGDAELLVAGGIESMSRAPYLLFGARTGWKSGDQKVVDAMIHDGLCCAFECWHMGEAAEHIASQYGVSREAQGRLAVASQRRAA